VWAASFVLSLCVLEDAILILCCIFLLQQKIKLPKKTARRYPAYELYLYGEGNYAEENKNLILTGIPILFLPGNAGSYKQGKPLANLQPICRVPRVMH